MKWNLEYLYKDYESFKKDLEAAKTFVDTFKSYKGTLSDEKKFVEYFSTKIQFEISVSRIYQYASLKSDLNKKDTAAASDLSMVEYIIYGVNEACAFEEPEVISIGYDKVMKYVENNKEIAQFKFIFEKLFHSAEHVLDEQSENILSIYNQLSETGANLYSDLAVADGKDREVTLSDGKTVKVTQGSYHSLMAHATCAEDRKKLFEALYATYDAHANTYAGIYKSVLDADKAVAKSRKFTNSLEAHLFNNNIPTSVYHNLIEVARNNSQPIKRYIELRKKILGLDEYHTYDRIIPLAKSDKKYSYTDAKELFFDSIKHFPEEFQNYAKSVLEDGFVDVYEQPGKRTGAYSSGVCNLRPFILLNHDDTLDSAFTLAHEAGHSIHSSYALNNQPELLQNYTIFVAEIASTFNEHNLLDYFLQKQDASIDDKITVIQSAIDNIIATFYRQTLFAEYEFIAHELNEKGEPINHEVLSKIMIDLYKDYYGIDITKEVYKKFVWAYIPHLFYTPFYVYQYATSFAASFKIYKNVKENQDVYFPKYLDLLKAGGSAYPMDEVKAAGVDFTKKDAFLAVVERLNYLVDELETLVKQK